MHRILVPLFCLLVAGAVNSVRATTITVASPSNGTNNGTGCTLRDAIQAVNTRAIVGQCAAGSGPVDTINIAATIDPFIQRDVHSDNAALPSLQSGRYLNLFGNSQSRSVLSRNHPTGCFLNGAAVATEFRLMEVQAGAALFVADVDFNYGCADGPADPQAGTSSPNARGGAIANYGTLYLARSKFEQNSANGFGGAIYNGTDAQLGIQYADFEYNSGNGGGGAVFVDIDTADNYAKIETSLFQGNRAFAPAKGGGIRSLGTLVVRNSTFNENGSNGAGEGSGIHSAGALGLSFATLHDDAGNTGVLVIAANSFANIKSTLFDTQNSNHPNCTIGNGASVSWSGVSISNDSSCAGGANLTSLDPGIDPSPRENGGPTLTLKLLPTSPALGVDLDCVDVYGDPVTTDQRGYPRPHTRCDAGAFEGALIFTNGFE
jgi:predicted outer membrane repeat protein